MNLALVYDTETTGMVLWKEPSEHPNQPHLVQLAACLVDLDTRKTVSSIDVIVRPNGWVIPDDVAKIHGITTEMASDVGVGEIEAMEMILSLWGGRKLIAHNESFDRRIMRIALKRYCAEADPVHDRWKDAKSECTALLSTPILKLPPTEKMLAAGFNKHKTPNLGEAYQYFIGSKLVGAHSAMTDVKACRDIYFNIEDLKNAAG